MACVVAVDEVPLPRLEGTSSGEDLDRSPGGIIRRGKPCMVRHGSHPTAGAVIFSLHEES